MERLHVLVFANCKPILDSATRDRWVMNAITPQMKLQDITGQVLSEHDAYIEGNRQENDRKEAMRVSKLKRKWERYAAQHADAPEFVEHLQQMRQSKIAKHVEQQRARDVHVAQWETPIGVAVVQGAASASSASTNRQ